MNIRFLTPLLLVLLLSACDFALGLDVMNTASKDITVAIDGKYQTVAPGLSFHGTFPAPEDHAELVITEGSCRYGYILPDLNREPWRSLIGKSVKFRWFGDGRMVAYPPTPDVEIRNNPQRASAEETRTIKPVTTVCR